MNSAACGMEVCMNCYVCARQGTTEPAVAVCAACYVGLCVTHLGEAEGHEVGGTKYTCRHVLPKSSASSREGVSVSDIDVVPGLLPQRDEKEPGSTGTPVDKVRADEQSDHPHMASILPR